MSLLFLEAASLQICYASDNSVSSVNSDTNSMTFSEIFSRQEQQRVDEEYRGDYRNYKNKQNNLNPRPHGWERLGLYLLQSNV